MNSPSPGFDEILPGLGFHSGGKVDSTFEANGTCETKNVATGIARQERHEITSRFNLF
jgi:hypothetical protein